MTRSEEYNILLAALEHTPPELERAIGKALKRKRLYSSGGVLSGFPLPDWLPVLSASFCW